VNPHELSRRWEEVLVDAVNDVGVDLNKSISSLHLAGLLPFVSGLGFRKVAEGEKGGVGQGLIGMGKTTFSRMIHLPRVAFLSHRSQANALRAAIRNTYGSLVVSRAQLIEEGLLTPKVGQRGG